MTQSTMASTQTVTSSGHYVGGDAANAVSNVGSIEVTSANINSAYTRDRYQPVQLSVDDYRTLHEQGFLKISNLIPQADIDALSKHMDETLASKETTPGFPHIDPSLPEAERLTAFNRIHNAHRVHPLHERMLLHPRVLDVIEQLSGPDILALQSMMFFKQPGQKGQGYHQDAYYIHTLPNTLIAAWIAVTHATEENGCLWFRVGSQHEPIYPPPADGHAPAPHALGGVFENTSASVADPALNQLAAVAARYPEVSCPAEPGDVVFLHGNVLHRSHDNHAAHPRRAFASNYCDARSFVPWNIGDAWDGMEDGREANAYHILARGDTHLGFARPKFGTPCAAVEEREPRVKGARVVMPMGDGGRMKMREADTVGMVDM